VPTTTTPPPNATCPFPHWPPIIPPIVAILLSILMVPCYCYSCGPWSIGYWQQERRKIIIEERYRPQHFRPTNYYNEGVRRRVQTNGYGRIWAFCWSFNQQLWRQTSLMRFEGVMIVMFRPTNTRFNDCRCDIIARHWVIEFSTNRLSFKFLRKVDF